MKKKKKELDPGIAPDELVEHLLIEGKLTDDQIWYEVGERFHLPDHKRGLIELIRKDLGLPVAQPRKGNSGPKSRRTPKKVSE